MVDVEGFFWPSDLEALIAALQDAACHTVCFNNYSGVITQSYLSVLMVALEVSTVGDLKITNTNLGDSGAYALALGLSGNSSLHSLTLDGDKIGDDGALSISEMLRRNSTITYLRLCGNPVGDLGLFSIATAVNENNTLKTLSMSSCKITDYGAKLLAQVLLENLSLTELDLTGNSIGWAGAKAIKKSLQKMLLLTMVRLRSEEWDENNLNPSNESRLQTVEHLYKNSLKEDKIYNHSNCALWDVCKIMVLGDSSVGKSYTVRSLLGLEKRGRIKSPLLRVRQAIAENTTHWRETTHDDLDLHAKRMAYRNALRYITTASDAEVAEAIPPDLDPEVEEQTNAKGGLRRFLGRVFVSPRAATTAQRYNDSQGVPPVDDDDEQVEEDPPLFEFDRNDFIKYNTHTSHFVIYEYGGQSVLYSMHAVLMTNESVVYCIVFDLNDLSTTAMSCVRFWISSVRVNAPGAPVILIGTHLDDVLPQRIARTIPFAPECLETHTMEINKLLDQNTNVIHNAQNNTPFFPISNMNGDSRGLDNLRHAIAANANTTQSNTVSLKWARALDLILAQSHEDNANLYSTTLLCTFVEHLGEWVNGEVNEMLQVFNNSGVVLYFKDSVVLRECCVVKPLWLVKQISIVLHEASAFSSLSFLNYDQKGLSSDVKLLFSSSLATRDILEFMWSDTNVDFLIGLMEQHLLLSKWQNQSDVYLVPTLLAPRNTKGTITSGIRCSFEFKFLPPGVFSRLVCLCVSYTNSLGLEKEPVLKNGFCQLWFGNAVFLERNSDNLILCTIRSEDMAAKVLNVMESMLRKIRSRYPSLSLKWSTCVEHLKRMIPFELAKKYRLQPWIDLPTVNNNTTDSEINYDNFLAE